MCSVHGTMYYMYIAIGWVDKMKKKKKYKFSHIFCSQTHPNGNAFESPIYSLVLCLNRNGLYICFILVYRCAVLYEKIEKDEMKKKKKKWKGKAYTERIWGRDYEERWLFLKHRINWKIETGIGMHHKRFTILFRCLCIKHSAVYSILFTVYTRSSEIFWVSAAEQVLNILQYNVFSFISFRRARDVGAQTIFEIILSRIQRLYNSRLGLWLACACIRWFAVHYLCNFQQNTIHFCLCILFWRRISLPWTITKLESCKLKLNEERPYTALYVVRAHVFYIVMKTFTVFFFSKNFLGTSFLFVSYSVFGTEFVAHRWRW